MSEPLELVRALVSPTEKLIDAIKDAVGTVYEPRHKRKMADAAAYEINVVSKAMRNAADMSIVYDENGMNINSEDFRRFVQRTGERFVQQELTKQRNIENVIDNAYDILEKEDRCSEEPIERGWLNRFFNSVADISDEDLQKLWGKVLAGEIKQPKSYSLRTLETLKNISKHEAELFQKIVPYIVDMGGTLFLASNDKLLKKHGINYAEIMHLDECGLINSNSLITVNPSVSNAKEVALHNRSKLIIMQGIETKENVVSIGSYSLTGAGIELFHIMQSAPDDNFLYDLAEDIVSNNIGKVLIIAYKINYIHKNRINYDNTVLHEFPQKENEGEHK